ncbi:phage holin family protein [Paenibacillus cisolokensis]|jgi:toxin secretion/phage lysis holin|uniref:Holin n=1 Tax=Paenibacillus cisolokensis TaxID=1658519 RepID=A0ABQ4NH00_9BACL|nr:MULTISPECIES: phage holin family protein [Paenibacillus]ALS25479.1 holin [Paenibacillus sp. 32O-W]GIQ67171.1 hypothetical protein PACILC2_57390 [Paenibacillus cisolokensis]
MTQIKDFIAATAIGATGKEAAFGVVTALAGVVASALGGWDIALQVLIALIACDYITGILGAVRQKKVNSEVMFWGGVRKAVILSVIALATLLDKMAGGENPIFRTLALYYYAGREGLSVVENLGVIGVPLPPGLVSWLEQLRQKGEANK